MNWSNIEKDVALQTESIVNASKRFDGGTGETHVSIGDSSSIFVNNRLSLSSEYSPNNDVVFDGNASLDSSSINPGNHVMKVVFNEVSELRNALRLINSNLSKHDHDSMDLKRNHIQIFERLDLIEYSIKDDSLMASRTVTTIDDIHSELKKIESRLADMEQNHRSYSTQFASHESLRRACDSSLDQIHTLLTASMEESKNETYKISELSNALMGALINLSGDPSSRYHVDLLNSFKKDINKDRIMRAVTDSMLRAVDSSVEMHLKTSLSFMNTSIHDILSDIRSRQESFEKSIMVTMSQREHIGDGFAKAMKVDTAAALEAETSRHLSETAQTFPQFASSNELDLLNDQVKQLSADNMNSKDALITQTILINNIINSHQQDRNHSIDELSAVKSLAASVESNLSEFKQAVEYSNQLTKKSIEDSVNFNTNSIEITNSAIKRIESAIERVNLELDQRKAQGAEFAKKLEMHSKLMEASSRLLNSRIDELGRTVDSLKSKSLLIDEMSAAVSKCQQELMKCEDFKSELMLLQSKCTSYDGQMGILIDIQMKQSKYEELHAISLEMQSKFTKHDRVLTENDADLKSLSRELTLVNDDVSSLRGKLQMDANEMLSKLNRRADALDATQVAIDSRISSVGNDIIKKDQDMQDSMLRFSKKFDKIEADIQTRSSIIIDTQSKLHALAEEVSQFIQKTKIDDVVFGTQVDSLLSNLRSFKADNEESCAKISRKVDICEAELQSRFQMKCDKLEHQFVQSSDSVTRLLQTLDHVERTTFSKISEVTVELRSKLSDVLELVSRQSLRVDQANSEIHSKLNLSISNFEASFALINEKYANFTKNIEICVETVNSNVYSYKNELAAHVDSTVQSLSMLAQQLVDMARLQARQDETNASVSNRLEEKCDIAVLNLKRECSDQIKIVQAALNEMNYDLLQLAGKISMSDALHLKHLIIGRDSQEKAESKRLFNEDQASLEVQLLDNTIREVNELQALTNVLKAKSLAMESTVDSLEKHVSELTKLDLVEFIIHVEQQFTKLNDEVKILQTSLIGLESSIRHIETSHAMKGNAHIDDVVATVGELSVKSVRYHMKLDSLQTQIDLLQNEIMELTQLPHFSSDTSTTMAPTTAQPSAVTAVDDYETGSDSGSDIFPESVDVLKQYASNSSPLGSNMYSEHTAAQAVDSNPATDSVISSPANSVASKSDSFLSDDEESQASKERPHSVQAVEDEPSNAIGSSTGSSSIMRSGSLIGRNKKPPFSK
jgi:chromosome segregation ATPase